jgi:hypothetical protein
MFAFITSVSQKLISMNMRFAFLAISFAAALFSVAQEKRATVPETAIDSLNDEFSVTGLNQWTWFHQAENFPDKVRISEVKDGLLHLQTYASGWYADWQAPFLYKTVTGNFDVRMRIKVSGLTASLPQTEWSLAGLMVRQPKKTTSENWEPRQENWLFLTTGVAEPLSSPVFEAKTTGNSISNLKLRPGKEGWVELRMVRLQASFILLYRYDNEAWTVLERFYRPLLPATLQVGLNAYSGYKGVPQNIAGTPKSFNETVVKEAPADMLVQVDYVRFARPKVDMEKLGIFLKNDFKAPYYTPFNLLTDYSLSNEDLLKLLL